jgi:hypothetical protein
MACAKLRKCGFYFYTDLKIMAKSWEFPLHAQITKNINQEIAFPMCYSKLIYELHVQA